MSVHTWKRCPHCNKTYEHYTSYTKSLCDHDGSPFITCKFCGKGFVDKDIVEPALNLPQRIEVNPINCVFTGFVPFGLGGIVLLWGSIASVPSKSSTVAFWIGVVCTIIWLLLVIAIFTRRKEINLEAKNEYIKSVVRLSSMEYAIALANAGFTVPEEFLNTNNEDLQKIRKELDEGHYPKALLEQYYLYKKTGEVVQQAYCLYCESPISDSALFCSHCGRKITNKALCPNCNSIINEKANYCTACGANLICQKEPCNFENKS